MWRHVVQRHVWTLVIVEGYRFIQRPSELSYGVEFDILQQLVLDGVVLEIGRAHV